MGGDASQGWLILKYESTIIDLLPGMFEKDLLTFNPGWDLAAQPLVSFTDVAELRDQKKESRVADETAAKSFMFMDSDGNSILIDQLG